MDLLGIVSLMAEILTLLSKEGVLQASFRRILSSAESPSLKYGSGTPSIPES